MKFYTSYFYQVRNFTPNIIPLSTAVFDPKWYKAEQPFLDKNNVINGLKIKPLIPINHECRGSETCTQTPDNCTFLNEYKKQLDAINFEKLLGACERYAYQMKEVFEFDGEPEIAIMFHETPDKICSERVVVKKWFAEHNMPIEEFKKK